MNFLIIYAVTFVVFFLVDIIWLGFISKPFYAKYLGNLRSEKVNWPAALIFYFLFIGGLVFFAINPAIAKESLTDALLIGGFFGLIAYSTYDLTNLATLKDWPVIVTIVDIIWGTILNSATAGITYLIVVNLLNLK